MKLHGIASHALLLPLLAAAGWIAHAGESRAAVQEPGEATRAGEPRAGPVYRVPIEGVIELGLAPFVERSVREAAAAGASVIILDVDTPGGRVDAAERIADAVSDSEVPVYAYVNRRAISAGALISLAAHGIYMRPGSVMGAATPVMGSGEVAPEKVVSAMRSSMRSLAEARGLDPAIAEAMVDPAVEVPGVVAEGRLLTLTTEDAVGVGYALEVETWDDLMTALGTAGNQVADMEVNWAERLVASSPTRSWRPSSSLSVFSAFWSRSRRPVWASRVVRGHSRWPSSSAPTSSSAWPGWRGSSSS